MNIGNKPPYARATQTQLGVPTGVPNEAHVTTVTTVLSTVQLQVLRSKLPRAIPREGSTPQEVGYLLGIQHVLNVLSEGFTV